jgi:hypothetical protein
MNFVQLCEELILEAELLEEALNALSSDPEVRQIAQDMKDFAANFKNALKSNEEGVHDQARKDQLAWREKLEQAILNAFRRVAGRASRQPVRTEITWKELDDYISTLIGEDKVFYNPFRLLHTSNFEEDMSKQIQAQ